MDARENFIFGDEYEYGRQPPVVLLTRMLFTSNRVISYCDVIFPRNYTN
jgi:hypothetical protein